jgi:hypothetical protein
MHHIETKSEIRTIEGHIFTAAAAADASTDAPVHEKCVWGAIAVSKSPTHAPNSI